MSYTVTNLTSSERNNNPQDGDLLKYSYDNGMVVQKYFVVDIQETTSSEEAARVWRDAEIYNTDFIVPLTDYPNKEAWITYRQQLRDWPSTDNFPNTKPTKP